MSDCCLLVLVIFVSLMCLSVAREDQACYGSSFETFMHPKCLADEVIAVDNVYALTKKVSSGCPKTFEVGTNESCCVYSVGDCKNNYTGVSRDDYYKDCTGLSGCDRQVTWQNSDCGSIDYWSTTTYMLMGYRCIPKSDIITLDSNAIHSGPIVHIHSSGFPLSGFPGNSGGTCSVSASCITSIKVRSLQLQLMDGASCQQNFKITDGSHTEVVECTRNAFVPFTVYISTGHFLIVKFENTIPTDSGKAWLQFQGLNSNAVLGVRCGSSALATHPNPSTPSCPETTPSTTTTSTTTTSTTTEKTGLGTATIAGIVVGVLLILAGIMACLLICTFKKKNTKMMQVSDKQTFLPDEEFATALGLSSGYMETSLAPQSSAYPGGPARRLAPIPQLNVPDVEV